MGNVITDEITDALEGILSPAHLHKNEPMAAHTTFRVGGAAEVYVTPDADELAALLSYLSQKKITPVIIGNGSNLLVSDKGIRGIVIHLGENMASITVEADEGRIRAEAGALLGVTAQKAAAASLCGMEFAAGIPGSIGGAVVMNAGAYGDEMKDIIETVAYLDMSGRMCQSDAEDLRFSYRHSRFMEEPRVVTAVSLRLDRGDAEAIRCRMRELSDKRAKKQPLNFPSAGSTFKRPEGHFAGKLIEDAGLKGYRVGGACVSEKHGGFVINEHNATAADIYAVICDVQKRVKEQTGILLEPEVRLIGDFT